MKSKPKIMCVLGTRPDAIKMAPVVCELLRFSETVQTVLVSTGQHREMLDPVLETFSLQPDLDLGLMQAGQSLAKLTSRALIGLDEAILRFEPDYVLAQGDTTSTFCASLSAFYRQVPFGHVEAGLRTETIDDPFPEEFNRRSTGLIASQHFAPTELAARNLREEGKPESSIFVTGNTGIDAVLQIAKMNQREWFPGPERVILLTTHRRENWGARQEAIAEAALQLVSRFEDCLLVVPMHRNPDVRRTLGKVLNGQPRVHLIEPPDYADFVSLMRRSTLILTDSGGVQEEAPSFGIPILVLRNTTERPEGISAGTAKLAGTDLNAIVGEGQKLLSDPAAHALMAHAVSPYGDGLAAQRIRIAVFSRLKVRDAKQETQ